MRFNFIIKDVPLTTLLKRLPFLLRDYMELKRQAKAANNDFPFKKLNPRVADLYEEIGTYAGHYFFQDLLVANKIFKRNPEKHVDIGSRLDGFIAHLASFREVEVFDIRDLKSQILNISFKHFDLMDDSFNLSDYCDSISCLHALEHFGLGRYGDKIDYNGHLIGWKKICNMLKEGGKFYFSAPIGEQRIEFNAHRVFSIEYLLYLIKQDYEIDSFSYVNDEGNLMDNVPLAAESIKNNFACDYGCAIFELTKSSEHKPCKGYQCNSVKEIRGLKLPLLKIIRPKACLSSIKRYQISSFNILKHQFAPMYSELTKYDIQHHIIPMWKDFLSKIEKAFLPYPPFNFLKDPVVGHTMFVDSGGNWFKQEISFLEKKQTKNNLNALLQEDFVGGPDRIYPKHLTSHNSVHHLYHLLRFSEKTNCDLASMTDIIEWGGGYGNLVKILHRLQGGTATYTIIDLPLFSCLQWLYLSTILGTDQTHILKNPHDTIMRGKINLVPLCFLENLNIKGDLFISSWALSESSRYSQDYVVQHDWFEAKHILIAYHDDDNSLPDSCRIGKCAKESGATIEDIDFLPGQHYAFR